MRGPPSTWKDVQLGDHVDLLTGHPFKSDQFSDDPTDVALLRGDNVGQGVLRWVAAKRWKSSEYDDFEKFKLREGDVILAMDRPWITAGLKYAWIKSADLPALLVQRVARMRGANGLLTDYLRGLIGSQAFTDHVLSIITGVNVPHISGRDIKSFRFLLPPLPTQRRIASILSAYDDLIENNTRRIAILEEMARRLYEEWFVRFRFPGREAVKIIGGVPVGWEQRTLGELADDTSYGYTARADPEFDGPRFLRITDIAGGPINWSSVPRCEIPEAKRDRVLLAKGDIVVARTGATTGWARRVGRQSEPTVFASYLVRFRFGLSYDPYMAATFMQSDTYKSFVKRNVGGAAQPNANAKVLASAKVAVPPSRLQASFGGHAEPMFDRIDTLVDQNANLRAQRDLLLPKLVSGEIDVSAAEEGLEAVA